MSGLTPNETTQPPATDITALLHDWHEGDEESFNRLILLVYRDLREMARRCMARDVWDLTLAPTALVHEACQRMIQGKRLEFESRFHFFRTVSLMMRQILVHYARFSQAEKRGGNNRPMAFDEMRGDGSFSAGGISLSPDTLLALDQALDKLHAMDPFKAHIVTLRFIVGLSVAEIALVMDTSTRTVKRSWQFAKHWLARELKHP